MGRLMNNYFYGKAGKPDFQKNNLPHNRKQLFWEMLRIRFAALIRMNLMTLIAFLPIIVVIFIQAGNFLTELGTLANYDENGRLSAAYVEQMELSPEDTAAMEASYAKLVSEAQANGINYLSERFYYYLFYTTLYLIPCIFITGPIQAGMAYVNRNWARDEHAFIWSDFKDAVKDNWKQGLLISGITAVVPFIVAVCWHFYNGMYTSTQNLLYMALESICIVLGVMWFLALVFAYPMMVGYQVTNRQLIKNSITLAIARLPHTVAVRLATLLPAILAFVVYYFFAVPWVYIGLFVALYYAILGNAFARFVFASFTNGLFEKYMNPHIEGARTNIGLHNEDDEDPDDDEEEEETPAAPEQ